MKWVNALFQERITSRELKVIGIVLLVIFCSMFATDIHLASMPSIMQFMHTTKHHMQQSISIFLLGVGISVLFYGPLSDKYGRKPIVSFGLIVAAIASFLVIFTKDIYMFLVMRLIQGVGVGVCTGIGRTILADLLKERLAAVASYISIVFSLSPLLAPALGGYIQVYFGWQGNFILLGLLITLAVSLFIRYCPETNEHKNPDAFSMKSLYINYKSLLFHRLFLGGTLVGGLMVGANMVYVMLSPFILQIQYQLSPIIYGWLIGVIGVVSLLSKMIMPIISRRFGADRTIEWGLVLLTTSGVFIVLINYLEMMNIACIIVAVSIAIFGILFVMPLILSKILIPFHKKRGAAGALYSSVQMLIAFTSSAIVAVIGAGGSELLGVSYVVMGCLGLCSYYYLVKAR